MEVWRKCGAWSEWGVVECGEAYEIFVELNVTGCGWPLFLKTQKNLHLDEYKLKNENSFSTATDLMILQGTVLM